MKDHSGKGAKGVNSANFFFLRNLENGSTLIVVIWYIVILAMLTAALSRRVDIQLSLTKYLIRKLQARYLAWAGLQYAFAMIASASQDQGNDAYDNLWQCGIKLSKDQTPEEVFGNVRLSDGHFTVGYFSTAKEGQTDFIYGLSDEERNLNLNALNGQNNAIFKELLVVLGVPQETAQTIAAATVDWRDEEQEPTQPPFGDEGAFYQGGVLSYLCKNRPLGNVEELLLVKGMTREIYEKTKNFITVFPQKAARLAINFHTAPKEILQALGRSVAGSATNSSSEDADAMARKVADFRNGLDGIPGTEDDRPLEIDKIGLNSKERAIYSTMSRYMTRTSKFLRIRVTGQGQHNGIRATINAVIYRDRLSILSWEAN